jgi:hypothetical protein
MAAPHVRANSRRIDHDHATFDLAHSYCQHSGDVDRLHRDACRTHRHANFDGRGNDRAIGHAISDAVAANCNITTDGDHAAHRDCFTAAHGYASANRRADCDAQAD